MTAPINSFVLSKDASRDFHAAWRSFAAKRIATAGDHLFQTILRGKDPLLAFSPVTNARKLANGQTAFQGLQRALSATPCYTAAMERIAPGFLVEHAGAEAALAAARQTLAQRLLKGARDE